MSTFNILHAGSYSHLKLQKLNGFNVECPSCQDTGYAILQCLLALSHHPVEAASQRLLLDSEGAKASTHHLIATANQENDEDDENDALEPGYAARARNFFFMF